MERCKSYIRMLFPAATLSVLLLVLCGCLYPLALNVCAGAVFPHQAKGSIVMADGLVVGTKFVGQEFTEDYFMKCRPSAVHYNTYHVNKEGEPVLSDGTPFDGPASGSTNYGPSNPALAARVHSDTEAFLAAHPDVDITETPADMLTASASGLDPHISPQAASIQLPAIAQASGLSLEALEQIVLDNTSGKLGGIFGAETVNVLGVNIDIANAMEQHALA